MDLAVGDGKIDMKRDWNWPIWVGSIITVGGLFSYEFFAQFPVTRDFPWANLLLFTGGGIFLVLGLFRAFGKPQLYRGKIFGPILAILGIVVFGFFSYLLRVAPGAALNGSAARWRKSADIHIAG